MNRLIITLFLLYAIATASAFTTNAPTNNIRPPIAHQMAIWDTVQSMYTHWGKKATASHILFKPSQFPEEEARSKLLELKAEIDNDADKFAAAAREWSGCPSSKNGGSLGEFGPGMMVKNFDEVCFNEEVGVVHGPVSTQFGEHLILITERK
ncbi:hypothetical protein ACHAXN_000342 [Cyclotella atomus]